MKRWMYARRLTRSELALIILGLLGIFGWVLNGFPSLGLGLLGIFGWVLN